MSLEERREPLLAGKLPREALVSLAVFAAGWRRWHKPRPTSAFHPSRSRAS